MKKFSFAGSMVLISGLLLLPPYGLAGDDDADKDVTFTGEVSVIGRVVDGEDESAKFEEYRDIPEPLSGEIWLRLEKKDQFFFDIQATDIAEEDQYLDFTGGWYGKLKLNINYDQIPHRFAYDAETLYRGFGKDRLVLSDAIQTDLQGTATEQLANRVENFFAGAQEHDLQILRQRGSLKLDLIALDPFSFRVEVKREERSGARPIFGSFGFSNTVEIPEPIDYNTTEAKVTAEYAGRPLYLSASYYLSVFENENDTLTWDNFFRVTDSTSATAYTATTLAGPSRGLIDLVPHNIFHQVALTGSLTDLPLRTRISATGSWGLMMQNDDLVPFTTNTAIVPGAAHDPPFDAWDAANLPAKDVDAEVNNYLVNVLLTSRPLSFMHAKARFRYYDYDNNTDVIHSPGYVRTDAVWEDEELQNLPTSYSKLTTGLDLGFDVFRNTRLTAGYTYDKTDRNNREVDKQEDHIFKGSIDFKPFSWLDLRGSYEHTMRDTGTYDFTVPFFGETEPSGQLPFLRKYDESDMARDRVHFLATVYPIEPLAISGSFIYGKDDYEDSPFGLLDDKHYIASVDADYTLTDRFNVFASYTYEHYKYSQKSRQWSPGNVGDPYISDTTFESFSNWEAEGKDIVQTAAGGFNWTLIPNRLAFGLSCSFSDVNGKIDFSSPLGTAADDQNAFIPIQWGTVDETQLYILHAKLKYRVWKGLSLTLGYMYEKFDFDDFNKEDFTNVPRNVTGGYNGAILMGTLPEEYDAHVGYTKLSYRF